MKVESREFFVSYSLDGWEVEAEEVEAESFEEVAKSIESRGPKVDWDTAHISDEDYTMMYSPQDKKLYLAY